jgi:hypothetical protein
LPKPDVSLWGRTRLKNKTIGSAFASEHFVKCLVDGDARKIWSGEGILDQHRPSNDVLGTVQDFLPPIGVCLYAL